MGVYSYLNDKNIRKMAFEMLEKVLDYGEDPVFLCVGNSSVVGDMLGPMVGDKLINQYNIDCPVFGTLDDNVKASNFLYTWSNIKNKYPLRPIIIVDSSLGDDNSVGYTKFCPYGCIPASFSNSKIYGNCSILGTVNSVGISQIMLLKTVKYSMIRDMSDFVAKVIVECLKIMKIIKNNSNKNEALVGCK